MTLYFEYDVTGGDFAQAGTASSNIKKILKQINIDERIVKKAVVALYEGEVNIVAHAWKGKIKSTITEKFIEVVIEDEGPGIADIEKAMEPGFSTASKRVREMGFGAGMGLPNIKKNVDEFKIESIPGKNTKLTFKIHF